MAGPERGHSDSVTMAPMTTPYAQRRARVAQAIGRNGIALIPTAPERQRNRRRAVRAETKNNEDEKQNFLPHKTDQAAE